MASVPPQGTQAPHQEFIQIDTTNILFIVGGAFEGIDKIIQKRMQQKTMGFGAQIKSKAEQKVGDILKHIMPEDLLNYGMIPEFVGRVPVIVTLDALDADALVKILTKPKNALVRQYLKFFELDGVKLEFEPDALEAVAQEAIRRKTGARGLRGIMEEVMLEAMYDIPSRSDVLKVKVTKDAVEKRDPPMVVLRKRKGRKKEASA